MTAITYELADADGDDYARVGAEEAELFANEPPEGKEGFVVEDVGRRRILAGRTALAGFDESFRTDRVMPRRGARLILEQGYVGPDNYIG